MKWDWARLCKPSHFWVSNNFRAKIVLNEKNIMIAKNAESREKRKKAEIDETQKMWKIAKNCRKTQKTRKKITIFFLEN